MSNKCSKFKQTIQTTSYAGVPISPNSSESEDDDDSFLEPNTWLSDTYHYDKILTIENDSS